MPSCSPIPSAFPCTKSEAAPGTAVTPYGLGLHTYFCQTQHSPMKIRNPKGTCINCKFRSALPSQVLVAGVTGKLPYKKVGSLYVCTCICMHQVTNHILCSPMKHMQTQFPPQHNFAAMKSQRVKVKPQSAKSSYKKLFSKVFPTNSSLEANCIQ